MQGPEHRGWLFSALILVGAITVLRLILLAFNRTDPFVDEVQYWLWGQSLDWGYYSKPPLIAWVMRAVTDLAGSDAPFWLRMPGAVLHGVTALILGALAARLYGPGAALWVTAGYLTLPMVAVGSLLFSTDTVMAPPFAGALFFWHRAAQGGLLRDAVLAGVCAGLAMMAKYAGIFILPGLALAGLIATDWRASRRQWLVFLGLFALVISPNVVWNLTHDLATLSHTADNAGWLREGARPSLLALLRFWAEQFAVAGPLIAAAFLWRAGQGARGHEGGLIAFAALVLAVVSLQAFLDGANANWAVAAWLPGSVVAMAALAARPMLRLVSLGVNGLIAVALPLLTLFPQIGPEGNPLLQRYLGRADLSRQILTAARNAGGLPIVAENRDVLADLFYTGRGQSLAIYARPHAGRPRHYYEQVHALPGDVTGAVLLVAPDAGTCPALPMVPLQTTGGAYASRGLALWRVQAACLHGQ